MSPNVATLLEDRTLRVINNSTNGIGCVLSSNWGAINEITPVNNETELIDKFGKPSIGLNEKTWGQISEFLNFYGSGMNIVRVVDNSSAGTNINSNKFVADDGTAASWAVANGANEVYRPNIDTDPTTVVFDTDQVICFYARYAGSEGDNISFAMCANTYFSTATYDGTNKFSDAGFSGEPGAGEVAIIVLYNGTVVETHIASSSETALDLNNNSKFIDDLLERESKYILSVANTSGTPDFADYANESSTENTVQSTALAGGASVEPAYAEVTPGYDILFTDEQNGILFIMDTHDYSDYSEANALALQVYLAGKADVTKRHYVRSTMNATTVAGITSESDIVTALTGLNSKFISLTYQWKQINDRYNKKKYFIPCTGDIVGIHVNTLEDGGPHIAPFGLNKGLIRNCSKVKFNFPQGPSSLNSAFSKRGVNTIVFKQSVNSFVLWGQYTQYNMASSLSRIQTVNTVTQVFQDVTPLLENLISDNITLGLYQTIRNTVDRGYLVNRAADGWFSDADGDSGYLFICDETNNSAEDRNNYTVNCDLYMKPVKAAEFFKFRIILTSDGVTFSEITG